MTTVVIEAKKFFSLRYFHGQSAACPHAWPVLRKNGKVRAVHASILQDLGQVIVRLIGPIDFVFAEYILGELPALDS